MMPTLVMALLMGLTSTLHCWGMCGGIVAALRVGGAVPQSRTLTLIYNLGRLTSYGVLGALAGGLAAWDVGQGGERYRLLQAFACVALVLAGLQLGGWRFTGLRVSRITSRFWRVITPFMRHLLPVNSVPRAWAAGMLWGFIPCGLVYSMLAVSAASGSAWRGAATMLMFALGTQPALLTAGLMADRLSRLKPDLRWRRAIGLAVMASALLWFFLQTLVMHAPAADGHAAHQHVHGASS